MLTLWWQERKEKSSPHNEADSLNDIENLTYFQEAKPF